LGRPARSFDPEQPHRTYHTGQGYSVFGRSTSSRQRRPGTGRDRLLSMAPAAGPWTGGCFRPDQWRRGRHTTPKTVVVVPVVRVVPVAVRRARPVSIVVPRAAPQHIRPIPTATASF